MKENLDRFSEDIRLAFCNATQLPDIERELTERNDGQYLTLYLGEPSERFYKALNQINFSLSNDNPFKDKIVLKKRSPKSWIKSNECGLLQKVLSESITIDKESFPDDFFSRYIKSIFGAEEQVISKSNHVVFGRRGSGKSSLLLYANRKFELEKLPTVWLSMQIYEKRKDNFVAADLLKNIFLGLKGVTEDNIETSRFLNLVHEIESRPVNSPPNDLEISRLGQLLRRIRQDHMGKSTIYIFLDDFHVVDIEYQATLLSFLYAITRGNNIYLKISAIDIFTKIYNPTSRQGLEIGNDIQRIPLDYNLTMQERAINHIESILNSHAKYCGIPKIDVLCNENIINRIVWVGAGVPRDAISVFLQALMKTRASEQKAVSLEAINSSAAESLGDKERQASIDSSAPISSAMNLLEDIKSFCIQIEKKNAFLVQIINNNDDFEDLQKLINFRFLHIIHKSITPNELAKRCQALILDYGFYLGGVRASKGIELFNKNFESSPKYEALRKLPTFPLLHRENIQEAMKAKRKEAREKKKGKAKRKAPTQKESKINSTNKREKKTGLKKARKKAPQN